MRIVGQGRATRTAAVTLLIVAIPAICAFLLWRSWDVDAEQVAIGRGLSDVVLKWKCGGGHTFEARGQVEPRKCPTCRKTAYAIGTYHCPTHGPFELAIRYAMDSAGVAHPSGYRIRGKKWTSATGGAQCPRCGRGLVRKTVDPFARKPRGRRRGGR